MKKTKLSPKFWLALVIFSLIGQIAWVIENMFFNVFIYKMFRASAADISLMVAASAVAATLTTIFIGALSDKLGKRKLFICGGYVLWGISILAFAFIRTDVIGKLFPAAVSAASMGVSIVIVMDCQRRLLQRLAHRFHRRHQPGRGRGRQRHDAPGSDPGGLRRLHEL